MVLNNQKCIIIEVEQKCSRESLQNYGITLSPSNFDATNGLAREWVQRSAGYLSPWYGVGNTFGARPVINLKSDTLITSGIGTSSDPFVVQ